MTSNWLAVAVRLSKEDLERLSDAELLAFADLVGMETGEELVKVSDRERAIERQLAGDLDEEYVDGVDEALAAELGLAPAEMTADEAVAVVSGTGGRLERDLEGERGARMEQLLVVALAASAFLGRASGIAALRAAGVPPERLGAVGASLNLADQAAMAALSAQQLFWIGRVWSDHLSKTISATISREALARGLGRAEVGGIVRGVVRGTFPSVRVPGTWPGSSEGYFTMLAGTVRSQATNYGLLETFAEAEVRRYQISAVMDQRTTEICQMMDGRTFSVEVGRRIAAARMDAEDPEEARAAAPWLKPAQVELLPGFEESPEEALANAGVAVPPFHGLCRTTVIPA